jgi:hypothetical protein
MNILLGFVSSPNRWKCSHDMVVELEEKTGTKVNPDTFKNLANRGVLSTRLVNNVEAHRFGRCREYKLSPLGKKLMNEFWFKIQKADKVK